jgi:hypothetical protein
MGKDPPYVEAVQNPLEDIALGRGVRYRGVYAPELLMSRRIGPCSRPWVAYSIARDK